MNRYLLYLLLLLPVFSSAQLIPMPITSGRAVGFYEFLPEGYNATGSYKYPLIINMHGDGEKGNGTTDLDLVLVRSLGEMLTQEHATLKFNFNGKQEAFIALLPQMDPMYADWMKFHIDSMINYAVRNLNIDPNRIFLSGYSLGGGGAWLYPSNDTVSAKRIAGIIPVSGSPGYLTHDLCNIAKGNVTVWAQHSVDDDAVPISVAITGVDGVNACGPNIPALSTYYPSGGHGFPWLAALDTLHRYQYPNMWEWMAATTRLNTIANNQDPVADAGSDVTVAMPATTAVLNGSASRDPNDIIVKYAWTKISGPSGFTIQQPNYPTTNITDLQYGNYIFQLSVTDEFGVVKTDQVSVNVTSALPIGLTYFKGRLNGKFNYLTWATSTEVNADHFDILRSTDGTNFISIGSFAAGQQTYSYTDEKSPSGLSYYRLKNVDKSGAFTYSDIITINNESPATIISRYPNPVRDLLNIEVQGAVYGKLEVSIHDLQGKLISKQTIIKQDISWKGVFNVNNLQKGVYTIQVQKAGAVKETSSFVKE